MITPIESMPTQPSRPAIKNGGTAFKDGSFLKTMNEISNKNPDLKKNSIILLNLLDGKGIKKTNTSKTQTDTTVINEQILTALDPNSLKFIIKNAKQELSAMIKSSPLATAKDIKQMPKTLKGLLQLAKSLKIDIGKITLKSIIKSKQTLKNTTMDLAKSSSDKTTLKDVSKLPDKLQKIMQTNLADTPLFQEVKKNRAARHLTNNIINSKIQIKPSAKKTDSSILAVLLNKDKPTARSSLKPDLKQITVPSHISLKKDALKADIQNNQQQPQQNIHSGNTLHVDAQNQTFTLKVHEAKQMVKYLAQNIRQTIDNYKPPFTKISLKLTPKKLGEVDLTVIQRGKNLHVNITSNNNAVNVLSQHSNDLKTQLSQNGMNNASLNFSNQENMSDGKNRHHQEEAKKIYRQLDEQNDDFSNSLEIIIPRYI